jgi:hypothetical protein
MKEFKNPIKIKAELIRETDKAYYLDCEGDRSWFPKSQVEFEKDVVTMDRWLFDQKFPDG